MATRCAIARKTEGGKIEAIYCHFDGYPEYTGRMLVEHYNSPEAVEELLSYGDASYIGSTLELCEFYHRDRKESWKDVGTRVFDSEDEFFEWAYFCGAEFVYLFDGSMWRCFDRQGYEIKLEKYVRG